MSIETMNELTDKIKEDDGFKQAFKKQIKELKDERGYDKTVGMGEVFKNEGKNDPEGLVELGNRALIDKEIENSPDLKKVAEQLNNDLHGKNLDPVSSLRNAQKLNPEEYDDMIQSVKRGGYDNESLSVDFAITRFDEAKKGYSGPDVVEEPKQNQKIQEVEDSLEMSDFIKEANNTINEEIKNRFSPENVRFDPVAKTVVEGYTDIDGQLDMARFKKDAAEVSNYLNNDSARFTGSIAINADNHMGEMYQNGTRAEKQQIMDMVNEVDDISNKYGITGLGAGDPSNDGSGPKNNTSRPRQGLGTP